MSRDVIKLLRRHVNVIVYEILFKKALMILVASKDTCDVLIMNLITFNYFNEQ